MPAAGFTIAPMTAEDVPDIAAIEVASFPKTHAASDAATLMDVATRLREELARAWAKLWVARRDERRLGFLLAWHVVDELHVLDVATHPAHRRGGIGRALMGQAVGFARENGVRKILLEVRRSNVPALALYRALGFYAIGLRRRYYPDDEDAVEMGLVLDPATGAILPHPDEVQLDE